MTEPPTDPPRPGARYRAPQYRPSIEDLESSQEPRAATRVYPAERDLSPGEHTSEFIEHEPCPRCGSQDNLARYDDGHAYCFTPGCGHYEQGDGCIPRTAAAKARRTLPMLEGEPEALPHRGLDAATCRRFRYWVGFLGNEKVEIANYFSADGERVAQKVRSPGKKFHWRGEPHRAVLFGQQLWKPGGKRVVVTEGEIDAMSVAQVIGNWPVVSVPNGAANARNAVRRNLAWLSSFRQIVLLFDQDDAGANAGHACAALLPQAQAHVAVLPLKDANEMLVAGRTRELLEATWSR